MPATAVSLARDRAVTRSTVPRPERMPLRVQTYPIDGRVRRTLSSTARSAFAASPSPSERGWMQPRSQSSTTRRQSSATGSARCRSRRTAPSGSGTSPAWARRRTASASSGSRAAVSSHEVRSPSPAKRRSSHCGSGVEPKSGANRSATRSRNRSDCSPSQADSWGVGSTSHASSAYGASVPAVTSAGIRAS